MLETVMISENINNETQRSNEPAIIPKRSSTQNSEFCIHQIKMLKTIIFCVNTEPDSFLEAQFKQSTFYNLIIQLIN